jgi:hypothetical protein
MVIWDDDHDSIWGRARMMCARCAAENFALPSSCGTHGVAIRATSSFAADAAPTWAMAFR